MSTEHDPDRELTGDSYCLWESADLSFNVGIVGTGPGYLTLLSIIGNEDYTEFMPPMRLCGVAKGAISLPEHLEAARKTGAPIHENASYNFV